LLRGGSRHDWNDNQGRGGRKFTRSKTSGPTERNFGLLSKGRLKVVRGGSNANACVSKRSIRNLGVRIKMTV